MENIAIGLLIPFIGTSLGSAMVFFMRNKINKRVEKLLLGFASGVMVAASIWSLIIPAIDMTEGQGKTGWIPAAIGFMLGVVFLLVLDSIIPHLHLKTDKPEGIKSRFKKTTMLVLAVTLHNIPEGMAVGVVFAGVLAQNMEMTLAGAVALSIGIAIQNFPEGAIISMPLKEEGVSKSKAFLYGSLSGIVEPIAATLTILLTSVVRPILPYILAFAAGAMIYVVVEELIPESQSGEHSNIGTIGVAIGFVVMMILDYITGILKAIFNKEINSYVGVKGIIKKVGYLIIVGVSVMLDRLMGDTGAVRNIVIYFFVANEGISIVENWVAMGLPMPQVVIDTLEQIKKKGDQK